MVTLGTFQTVDTVWGASLRGIAVSAIDGAVYACGTTGSLGLIRKSTTGASGTFSNIDNLLSSSYGGIQVSPINGKVFVCGQSNAPFQASATAWLIRSSSDGSSGSFGSVDFLTSSGFDVAKEVAISAVNGNVYVVGRSGSSHFTIRSSSLGLTGTWGTVYSNTVLGSSEIGYDINVSPVDGNVYACGYTDSGVWYIVGSSTGKTGSFTAYDYSGSSGMTANIVYRNIHICARWKSICRWTK